MGVSMSSGRPVTQKGSRSIAGATARPSAGTYPFSKRLWRDRWLYILLIPGVSYFVIFKLLPIWGILISFQNYSPFLGFWKSEWVGLSNFRDFFMNSDFIKLFRNTIILSVMNILLFFPLPILFALLLNEVKNRWFKGTVQTVIYIPHFISMVVIASISYMVLNTRTGPVNGLLNQFLGAKVDFLGSPAWFRPLILMQVIWKETGWGTIIFLAAIAGVDAELYEAAIIDGANRFQQLIHVTFPAIVGTIVVMLILRLGHVLDNGFEQILLMTNSLNREVADVFDTYVYTVGIQQGAFSYSTAIGLFKSLVGLLLVKTADMLAKRAGHSGIF
jgi:putative aldouronate transport system permease protein